MKFKFFIIWQLCRLLLGRKAMRNLDSRFKSRDITLQRKVHIIKAMFFSVVLYGLLDKRRRSIWELMLLNYVGETLESPLDCKEIKPVSLKGNQPSIFIGRTDAEAPILWPPERKSWLIGKDPDAGKDWGQEEKGKTGWDCWMASLTQCTWVWTISRRQWRTRKPVLLQFMGSQRVGHNWVTEQQ